LTVHDSGEAAGQLWFTMPFVEGESLRDRLNRERQLPVVYLWVETPHGLTHVLREHVELHRA
jgi:hypothetical protein